jgi:uncharacterized protein (DUF302 family)
MKSILLLKRRRLEAAGSEASSGRRARFWMTGSLAVVMAAFVPARGWSESTDRLLRHSRYGVIETAHRIEEAARREGLSVLARMGGHDTLIVLASAQGGTPVLMDESNTRLAMPMAVQLRQTADGGADVSIALVPMALAGEWQQLPSGVADEVRALPIVLDRALI